MASAAVFAEAIAIRHRGAMCPGGDRLYVDASGAYIHPVFQNARMKSDREEASNDNVVR
jgi:hypothetical protein